MSVINTMLKDLERRGVEADKRENDILGGLSANKQAVSEAGLSNNIYFISLLSIFSILLIIIAIYYLSPYKMVSVTQENVESPLASVESSEIKTQIINKPVLTKQDETAVTRPTTALSTVAKSIVAPSVAVQVPVPALETEESAPVIAELEVQAEAKPIQVKPATIPEVIPESVKQVVEAKPVVIKATVTKAKVTKTVAVKKQAMGEAESFAQAGDATESLAVVSKKQREYTAQEKSSQAYTKASSLYKRGSKQQARTLLKEAIAYSSSNINAYSLLAVIYLEDGRADLASEVIEDGLLKHTDDQALLRLYLQSLVQETRYKEAITVMEKRLRLTAPEDLGYLAGLYQKQNDHLSAVKFYARALQLKPSTSLWWMGQGISLEIMEKYEEALQSYQQSISTGQLSGKLAQYAISRMNTIKRLHADLVS